LFTPRELSKIYKGLKRKSKTASQKPFYDIQKILSSTQKDAERLTNSRLGNYRFRIGDYRVIFDLEEYDISVLRVGHRKEIYRKF